LITQHEATRYNDVDTVTIDNPSSYKSAQ